MNLLGSLTGKWNGLAIWLWIVIAVIVVALIIVVIVVSLKAKKTKSTAKEENVAAEKPAETEQKPVTVTPEKPAEEPVFEEETGIDDEQAEELPEDEEEVAEEPVEEAMEVEPKVVPEPVEEEETAEAEEKKKTTKVYHITKRKSDGKWQVKFNNGAKAIKLFNTQLEAIDYAKALAQRQEAGIMIHKEDGTFRRLNYKKKSGK